MGIFTWTTKLDGAGNLVMASNVNDLQTKKLDAYDVSAYASFAAAVAAIGATPARLWITSQVAATTVSTPATLELCFAGGGGLTIANGVTVTIGKMAYPGLIKIFTCTGTGKVVFVIGAVPEIDPRWFGATGDGTTEDSAAFQLAFDSAESGVEHLLPIRISPGTYSFSARATYGKLDTVRNGGAIRGTSYKTTEIVWTGATTDGPIRIRNVAGFVCEGFRLRGATVGEFALWYDVEGLIGAGLGAFDKIWLSNFTDGIRYGHDSTPTPTDVNSGPWSTFRSLWLYNCANGIRLWGVNQDDCVFEGIYSLNCHVTVRATGLHHITIKGGGADNANDDTTNIFLLADGVREGLTSIENVRIEAGNQLVWLGETAGDSVNNEFPHNLVVKNVAYASYPTGNTTTEIIRYGCVGTVTVEDCRFAAPDGYFSFIDFRSNRFATFNLINTGLISATPETANTLVRVTNRSVGAATGGVLVNMRGNQTLDDDTIYRPNAWIADRTFIVTPANALADTETPISKTTKGGTDSSLSPVPLTKEVAFAAGTSGTITIDSSYKTLSYVKVGSQVTITGALRVASVSSPVGELSITGLPFAAISGNAGYAAISISPAGLENTAITSVVGYIAPGSSQINIRKFEAGVGSVMAASVKAGSTFMISGTYFTT